MSGVPVIDDKWSRYRTPAFASKRRTRSSGPVFLDLTLAISKDFFAVACHEFRARLVAARFARSDVRFTARFLTQVRRLIDPPFRRSLFCTIGFAPGQ